LNEKYSECLKVRTESPLKVGHITGVDFLFPIPFYDSHNCSFKSNCDMFQLNLCGCLCCLGVLMGPHSCKDCLQGCMMAGSSKDDLRVPVANCEENGFGDVDSMPCMCSLSPNCKMYHYTSFEDFKWH
jgi:hypothetical protein